MGSVEAALRATTAELPSASWMGWEPTGLERLLEMDPDLTRIGSTLAGMLALRLLGTADADFRFFLYRLDDSGDGYELCGKWGTAERAGSFDAEDPLPRIEQVPCGASEGEAVLDSGKREPPDLFLPLESEEGILGFGIFRVEPGARLEPVPEEDTAFLGRLGGQALTLVRQSRRLQFSQRALASSTRYLERVLSMTGDGMLLVDAEGRILVANEALEPLLGRLPIEFTGRLLQDVIPADSGIALLTGVHLAAHQEVPITRTIRIGSPAAAGSRRARTVEASFERVQVDLEGAPGVLVCLRDLEQASRQEWFARSERKQEQVLNGLAQGLLRPVAALRGYLWLLRDEVSSRGRANDLLGSLELQAEWLQSQLETLVLMDEFRCGQSRWRDRPVSADVLFERALGRIQGRLRARDVDVRKDLSDTLPWVHVDVEKWTVVLAFVMDRLSRQLGGPGALVIEGRLRTPGPSPLQIRIVGERRPSPRPRRPAAAIALDSGLPQDDFPYGVPLARSVVHHYGGTLLWDLQPGEPPAAHLTIPCEREDGARTPKDE